VKQITVLFNGKFQESWLLDEPHIVIGRGRSAHIPLDGNPIVSRQHAIVREEGGVHVLEDLGGANGTFLNDNKVNTAPLRVGDTITIGKHTLRYEAATPAARTLTRKRDEAEEPGATAAVATVGHQPPPWTVEGKKPAPAPAVPGVMEAANATVAASKEELEHLLEQMKLKSGPHLSWNLKGRIVVIPCAEPPVRVGHSDSFEVRIPGSKWVGRLAAELVKQKDSWFLVAKSPFWNPVFVGKSKVSKRRKLVDGTTFRVGEHKLRFSSGES
jgi:predicted component of type VI protein secretion system